jgi:hypothetical protein
MPRPFEKDPTRFFTVVGAPYIHERRTETHYPRPLEIGVAAGGTIFCAVVLGLSLFAQSGFAQSGFAKSGFAKFAEVAQRVVK